MERMVRGDYLMVTITISEEELVEHLLDEINYLKKQKIPQLEQKIASIRGTNKVSDAKLKSRLEQVERLKQENQELREQLKKQGEY